MKRKEFGKLLAALRKSRHDERLHQLTQRDLAELTGISEQVLGNIERGCKVSLEADILLALSRSLRLSTRERREFLLAAIDINEQDVPANQPGASVIFNELFESLNQIALPAFIVDSYGDIVAANHIILKLLDFREKLREIAPKIVGGYNLMRFIFSDRSYFKSILGKEHEKFLMQCVRFFRAISLPYRATAYHETLLSAFRKDREMSLFNLYYSQEADDSDHNDYYFEGERFSLGHATLGELVFYSPTVFPISTSQGSLYLITYIPASTLTIRACATLAQEYGPGAMRLAAWPNKK